MAKSTTVWPSTQSDYTAAQQARSDEFLADINQARKNNADGYPFHIWVDGRLHDSAVTHTDAFDECRALRKSGFHGHLLIGSGCTDRTLTVSHNGQDAVRVELPA